ncbi:hypothetical protein SAMN02745134_00237 [Clostridium acidisoli DSM 12555]|uniref:Bacteriophage holin of superfamily 6 (Holin_LLH) n=1 Tax=Clostridium acidisoli DSM 12555 TaxID=1121291 RepID=A0A1W1WZR5_9CLOT|nr:hypothetical protein [Clostridium acidisoli]SMC17093.1 hypothetical protein SAMN02745134_00237 [Clostridium acidisoli DSM 12555]
MLNQSTQILINEIVIPVVGAGVITILALVRNEIKAFLNAHKAFIEKQEVVLQASIGIEQYNKDKQIVKDAVYAAEQLGKEFDWRGELKHSKVLEMIEGKTGLSDEEIYNVIKSTILEVNGLEDFNIGTKQVAGVQSTNK